MSQEVTLTYSDSRAYAEPIRMLLAAAGIKFRDVTFKDREEYLQLCASGKLLYNQTPLLEIDGLKIVQRRACLLYVAKKAGMLGQSDAEFAKILMYLEGTRDAVEPFINMLFDYTEEEGMRLVEASTIAKYLPIFNKVLEDSMTGYMVGTGITLADIGLFEVLMYVIDYFGEGQLDAYPPLKEFNAQMRADPGIAFYLEHHAKPKMTPQMADYVKKIYSHLKYAELPAE